MKFACLELTKKLPYLDRITNYQSSVRAKLEERECLMNILFKQRILHFADITTDLSSMLMEMMFSAPQAETTCWSLLEI
jgi:hypothetical protein